MKSTRAGRFSTIERTVAAWRTAVPWVLSICVLAVSVGGTALPVVAQPAGTTLTLACIKVLRDNHVTRPNPVGLFAAALNGVRQALSQAGVPGHLEDLAATTEDQAALQFQARFDAAVALARGRVSPRQLESGACRAMAASRDDSHTWFTPPEEIAENRRPGIGVRFLNKDGRSYFLEVFPNMPASQAGVRAFDRILTINGQSTQTMRPSDVAGRLRGDLGTTVTLAVQRPGQAAPLTFAIVRASFTVPVVEHQMLEGSVGYIRLRSFVRGSSAPEFRRALQDLMRLGVRALVVDVRANPGGSSRDGTEIASMLLTPGLPIEIRIDRGGRKETVMTEGTPLLASGTPVVVVVDEGTRSQGELFSAAIREHQRGRLVGARTGGALMWNERFSLPDGAEMSVSTMYLTTGKGLKLEKVGLTPDVDVNLTVEDLDRGVDMQMRQALRLATEGIR